MGVTVKAGMRQYTCLIPVVIMSDGKPVEYQYITMLPITRAIEREWQDGLIQGPHGAFEALVDRLTLEPFAVIDAMTYPDVEFFNVEFATHLPRSLREALANGQYPKPASNLPPPEPYSPDDDPEPPGDGGVSDPEVVTWPDGLDDEGYVGPDTPEVIAEALGRRPPPRAPQARPKPPPAAPAPARPVSQPFQAAEISPEPSATPDREVRAEAARGRRALDHDGKELARTILAEQEPRPENPALAAAVARSSAPPPSGFVPTPRNPFDPSGAPDRTSVNRKPTRPSAEQRAAAAGKPEMRFDPVAGVEREVVYDPGQEYVPEMHAVTSDEDAPRGNAFGIDMK